ncbi:MAG: SH3 domain-containing protein, partial [Spirochaetota bacterium]|nr:SH3 domain-containing protein [Spirochaetota bacterium]
PNYMKSPEEISYYIQKLCDEQIKSLKAEAKKTQDKKNISIYNKGIALYNMTRKQWINRQYKGKYRFIAPIKGFQAMINDKIVILRAGPTTKSPPVMTLYVGQKVRIKAVGKKVTLGHLGTHHWYQVTYFPNIFSDKKIVGWVFGVYLEPVLTEVK